MLRKDPQATLTSELLLGHAEPAYFTHQPMTAIDNAIAQCIDMQRTLEESNKLLRKFSRELQAITQHVESMAIQGEAETMTMWSDESDGALVQHRALFEETALCGQQTHSSVPAVFFDDTGAFCNRNGSGLDWLL